MQQHSYMGVESVLAHLCVDPGDQKQVIIFVLPASPHTEPSPQPFRLFLTIAFSYPFEALENNSILFIGCSKYYVLITYLWWSVVSWRNLIHGCCSVHTLS